MSGAYAALVRESAEREKDWTARGEAEARAQWEQRVQCWLVHPLACRCLRGGR